MNIHTLILAMDELKNVGVANAHHSHIGAVAILLLNYAERSIIHVQERNGARSDTIRRLKT